MKWNPVIAETGSYMIFSRVEGSRNKLAQRIKGNHQLKEKQDGIISPDRQYQKEIEIIQGYVVYIIKIKTHYRGLMRALNQQGKATQDLRQIHRDYATLGAEKETKMKSTKQSLK